jgi:two-component system LytT family response regulator
MNKLKVIILDDEHEALDILASLLMDTGKVEIIKQLKDPLKLESSVAALQPDAVFTDIQMPKYNGLEILKNLREYRPELPVVYITAHKKFAFEASRYNPFSYLLKPVNRQELENVVDHIIAYKEKLNSDTPIKEDKITLPVKDGLIYVHFDDIFSLTASGNYTNIKLINGKLYLSSYHLGCLHDKLNGQFVRINRHTVINSNYLKEINKRKSYCLAGVGELSEQFDVSVSFLKTLNK